MSGLREVKRVATRRALAHAALDLVREAGLDAVTIEDIVARAMEPCKKALADAGKKPADAGPLQAGADAAFRIEQKLGGRDHLFALLQTGADFDPVDGNSFIRLSFAVSTASVEEAIRRIEPWLSAKAVGSAGLPLVE